MAAADRYAKLAQEQYAPAKQAQDKAFNYYGGIVDGNKNAYRVAAPEVNFMKRQFANAKSQVRDYLPAGGQKNRAYRDLAMSQPGAISSVFQKKIEESLARLASLGQQGVGNTLNANQGVSAAGDSLAQLSAARANAVSSAIGGITGLAGFAFGGGFGGGAKKAPLSNYANTQGITH